MYLSTCTAPGWCPGGAMQGTADPSTTPNPTGTFDTIVPALKTAFLGAGGAAILVAAGVVALLKGFELMLALIRKRRSPQQLTLF